MAVVRKCYLAIPISSNVDAESRDLECDGGKVQVGVEKIESVYLIGLVDVFLEVGDLGKV